MDRMEQISRAANKKQQPKESQIVKRTLDAIKKKYPRSYMLKYHGGMYSVVGHPDIYGVIEGVPFFLEAKKKDKVYTLTDAQVEQLNMWRQAGAFVGVFTSAEEALEMIEVGLSTVE